MPKRSKSTSKTSADNPSSSKDTNLFEDNIENFRQNFESTNSLEALLQSVRISGAQRLPLQLWQLDAVLRVIEEKIDMQERPGKRGRNATHRAEIDKRSIDFMRFNLVDQLDVKYNKVGKNRIVSLEALFEEASQTFDFSDYVFFKGSAETIKKSYQRVARRIREGNASMYYDVGLLPGRKTRVVRS